jgi:hypothetical protein
VSSAEHTSSLFSPMMTAPLQQLLFVVAAASVAAAAAAAGTTAPKPNILLLFADDLGFNQLNLPNQPLYDPDHACSTQQTSVPLRTMEVMVA